MKPTDKFGRFVPANDNGATHKTCKTCSANKPIDAFNKAPKGALGRDAHCRECRPLLRDRSDENAKKREKIAAAGLGVVYRKRLLIAKWRRKALHERGVMGRRIDRYLAKFDKPWTRPGLTDADKYRLRYANDNEYMLRERTRQRMRRKGLGFDALWRMRRALNGVEGDAGKATIEAALGYSMAVATPPS